MHKNRRYIACRGFTLIESIIVLIVLSIAAIGIATLSSNIFNGQVANKNLQVGVKLMQECAEHVLGARRATSNFAAFTPNCPSSTLPAFSGFNAATVLTPVASTTTGNFAANSLGCLAGGSCGCPSGGSCKLVTISVSTNPGNDSLNPITLLLVGP